jgi:adenosyl cobinamide kinase/adenosyl cobinamide phosphate guanylyltransferase
VGDVTLLIGGARSGKSALAVEIGRRHGGEVVFIATAEPFDEDMRSRIARHRDDRPDWPVVEAPLDLGEAIIAAPPESLLIVDCLTVWVNNELHHRGAVDADGVATALAERIGPSVVITNEVGLGVHPETELGRTYRDELGRVNQTIAAIATKTLLMVAGQALRLGDPWKELE